MKNRWFLLIASVAILAVAQASVRADDDPSAKEKEARAKIVDYMRAAASVEWTPSADIPYWNKSMGFSFKAGETYYGIPYTQNRRDTDLVEFKTQLKDRDGKATYVGPNERTTYWGSDCSSTVSHAWRQIESDFPTLSTDQMIPVRQKRIAPVGSYDLGDFKTTDKIVQANGPEKIKKAYAELKPGDAVLTRRATGHVMLVVKNEPEKDRLFIIDQTGCDDDGVPLGQNGKSTMRIDCERTYDQLFRSNYIPIRLKAVDDLQK